MRYSILFLLLSLFSLNLFSQESNTIKPSWVKIDSIPIYTGWKYKGEPMIYDGDTATLLCVLPKNYKFIVNGDVDTVALNKENDPIIEFRMRVFGIDAPEMTNPITHIIEPQTGALEARNFLRDLITNSDSSFFNPFVNVCLRWVIDNGRNKRPLGDIMVFYSDSVFSAANELMKSDLVIKKDYPNRNQYKDCPEQKTSHVKW